MPEDWRNLVLHLIAAHHGQARPLIATRGCEDAPPSALEERAREVALRFARLQKRWGPWGLAWWEALLRAADQQASRDNDGAEVAVASHMERTLMAEAVDPRRPVQPGQVFACLGFLEAATVLLHDAEGGFDWSEGAKTFFKLRASGGAKSV